MLGFYPTSRSNVMMLILNSDIFASWNLADKTDTPPVKLGRPVTSKFASHCLCIEGNALIRGLERWVRVHMVTEFKSTWYGNIFPAIKYVTDCDDYYYCCCFRKNFFITLV
jgi:hypothetical protein